MPPETRSKSTAKNQLATYAIGLLVTVVVVVIAALVGGSFLAAVADAGTVTTENRVEWTADASGELDLNEGTYDVYNESGDSVADIEGEAIELINATVGDSDETANTTLDVENQTIMWDDASDTDSVDALLTVDTGEDSNALVSSVDDIVDNTGTAFTLFAIGIIIVPAIAVVTLIMRGFGGMLGGGRGGLGGGR